jgi:hypothetical protein
MEEGEIELSRNLFDSELLINNNYYFDCFLIVFIHLAFILNCLILIKEV